MENQIKYLESLLPRAESIFEKKYKSNFKKFATYTGDTYIWNDVLAKTPRELWLMGILDKEGINYKEIN